MNTNTTTPTRQKTRLVVMNENMFGYVSPEQPRLFCPLSIKPLKGANPDALMGDPIPLIEGQSRPATLHDLEIYRMEPTQYTKRLDEYELARPHVQVFHGRNVVILQNSKTGVRGLKIWKGDDTRTAIVIPTDIAELAAGKDAWMRSIEVPCLGCGDYQPCGKMQTGYCECCFEEQGEVNARMDAGE